ncbi:MAG: hypothetical protein H0T89_23805 [Deltaproteobacteria bacterium]|nr:hypothetical protein [Deltaproteobacteria bacterium]MDQ3297376.1 hypothetical protein [Myxococcota bacterium]
MRDGLVGVKRMEKAFQRQVIYGGSLDTILLEMNLVPEDRLTQYLALASGLPPAARDEGEHVDPAAVALLGCELAERFRAVPVTVDSDAVRVLVCSPLELSSLEDLADLLDRPIQPLITPEYRWHLVFAAAYALDAPARFTTLARSLDVDATVPPVGKAKTIIVDDHAPVSDVTVVQEVPRPPIVPNPARAAVPAPVETSGDATEKTEMPQRLTPTPRRIATPPGTAPVATIKLQRITPVPNTADTLKLVAPDPSVASIPVDIPRSRTATVVGVTPNKADSRIHPHAPAVGGGVLEEPKVKVQVDTPSTGIPRLVTEPKTSMPVSLERPGSAPAIKRRPATAPIATEGRDAPLMIVTARQLLATAEDRDTVFLTLLRAARSRARWAGLLTVQGGAAIGRVALAEESLDTKAIETVLIPLDVVSPFRTVVSNHQSHIGPLVSGDPGIDSMVLRLGGTMPPSALLLPIVIRERVVAIVVAHRVHSDIRLSDVTELLPMAMAASDAIARLIVKHKSAGYRAPTDAPVVEIEAEMIDTRPITREGNWATPDQRPSAPSFEQGTELSIEAEPPRPIDELLDAIEAGGEGASDQAISEALDRAKETIAALMTRFPGKLRVDRFSVSGRPLRAAQYGGLLELVVQLGSVAAELLIDTMGAPGRDVRFYATLCTSELRPRTAVFALAERLFDQDFGVRACAIEALAGYPLQDLGHALLRARRAVHSTDSEVVGAATAAIVELGDIDAIPDLIGVIERADRGGEHARKALIALTGQDFGTSEKKWRKWHEGARARHRIEWLIEGLGHKEDAIRENAIKALRRLTGEYFGYHHDLPKRDREAAAERWAAWWRDSGQRRFTTVRDDERHRPTAVLPIRHDPS